MTSDAGGAAGPGIGIKELARDGALVGQWKLDPLALWRPVTPESPDDQEGRFFESVLIARPGYCDQLAEDGPSRE
jgi:hypothetical protein